MPRLLTEQTFYRYLKCPHWVYFDAHADAVNPHDPLLVELVNEGLIEEKERALLAHKPDLAEVTAEDPESAFFQTLAFMRAGRQTIYRGVLIHGHWVGHPDVLERVEGTSNLGGWYYVAADVKRMRDVRDEYKFQGCFYAELLQRVQGVKPYRGYVITPDGEALPYEVEAFEAEFRLTLDEIERILAGQKPPHFSTSGCKQSPWFARCRGESLECNDISLLNRVWREEVATLEAAGIKTIDDVARRSIVDLENKCPDLRPDRLLTIRDQAVAIRDGKHTIKGRVELPKASVELYFDIESDPLRDFDYLYGFLICERGTETYQSIFAKDEAGLEQAWREICTLLESYHDAPIYHYGSFEVDVLKKLVKKYDASSIVREVVERNLIDINQTLRPVVIFPLSFYSLKDIAAYLGFKWRSDDASGANSVVWFEHYLVNKDPELKRKIVEYNEDDVRATKLVKDWLVKNAV